MSKALPSALGAAGALGVAIFVGYRLLGTAAGPDAQLLALVRQSESSPLTLPVAATHSTLISRKHHFDRLSVHLQPPGAAYVVGTLDFLGSIAGTKVSSVGLERVPFEYRNGKWMPSAGWAPQLTRVVGALEARRQTLDRQKQPFQPLAWYIRIERDQAVVTEEFRPGPGAESVSDNGLQLRRLTLKKTGSDFSFSEVPL